MTQTQEARHALELPQVQPLDEHNRELVGNVHPADWPAPEPARRYNLVVVGAGTAGLVTAAGAAGLGARVALVERDLLGGDCLNVGCVPSKALIRCARASVEVRDAADFGVRVPEGARPDFGLVMERMRKLRARISHHDSAARFKGLGIDVFLGEGRFTAPDTLEVGGRTLRFARACIATGARAAHPSTPGLAEVGYLTNETVFSLTKLPRRLAVLGGGPIGCELAQAFARFGSEVHLIQRPAQILEREDRDAAERIERALQRDGVRLVVATSVARARRAASGKVLELESRGVPRELEVDEVLVGVGRAPNVQGLGLEAAGVEYDERKGVEVDDRLRTTNPRIFAAGDVGSRYKFTHMADALARIVIRNALFFGREKASELVVPWCTFTDPEIAHVGLYPHEAEEAGRRIDTYTVELSEVDRAVLDGEEEGFLKVHVEKGGERILGATLVSRHAGETISELTLAIVSGAGLSTLSRTIHPYPTQAEALRKAGDLYQRSRLTPRVAGWMRRFLAWRR
jgi:pyruvate/2-oxoglutarate dehydrogenase complex dihydrolipoamide dehydrogenase (E3) component